MGIASLPGRCRAAGSCRSRVMVLGGALSSLSEARPGLLQCLQIPKRENFKPKQSHGGRTQALNRKLRCMLNWANEAGRP